MRADRTFHKRITIPAACGIALFSILAFYFFCVKMAIVGLLLVIIVVGMIERSTHTLYTFHRVKPVNMDDEMEFLSIDLGRFSSKKHIALRDILQVNIMKTAFGMDHYILITLVDGKMESVQPANEEHFLEELKKRQHEES